MSSSISLVEFIMYCFCSCSRGPQFKKLYFTVYIIQWLKAFFFTTAVDHFYFHFSTGPSPGPTTATLWVGSFCLTSPTAAPSRTSTTGWRKLEATSNHTASSSCWWDTSVTWKHNARCVVAHSLKEFVWHIPGSPTTRLGTSTRGVKEVRDQL